MYFFYYYLINSNNLYVVWSVRMSLDYAHIKIKTKVR